MKSTHGRLDNHTTHKSNRLRGDQGRIEIQFVSYNLACDVLYQHRRLNDIFHVKQA